MAASCSGPAEDPNLVPGYLEAELIEIASPEAGYLERLPVQRGQHVENGAELFALNAATQEFNADEAEALVEASAARLQDARLGLRPDEIDSLRAELDEAKARLDLSTIRVERYRALFKDGAATQAELDQAESDFTQATQQVNARQARLRLAEEGARAFQRKALEGEVAGAEARENLSRWRREQTKQTSPADAFVQDTLYQLGEWVPASRPVVLLRESDLLRVRFFLSPEQLKNIRLGDSVDVLLPGESDSFTANIDRISDSPEYTPPVIFSREQTAKLVFLVEARLPADWARKLHPGMPVSVRIK